MPNGTSRLGECVSRKFCEVHAAVGRSANRASLLLREQVLGQFFEVDYLLCSLLENYIQSYTPTSGTLVNS